jgi:hypothetical protein
MSDDLPPGGCAFFPENESGEKLRFAAFVIVLLFASGQ